MALDIPDIGEDLDLTLRQVTRQYPEHLARALLPAGTEVASVRWAETQAASRQRRLDRALAVVIKKDGELLEQREHIEWSLEMTSELPFRVFEYHAMESIALRDETPAGQPTPRIQSTVVLFSGRDMPWPPHDAYRTSPDDEAFSGVSYRIE